MPSEAIESRQSHYDAEAALLGCILISCSDGSPEAIDTVQDIVIPTDFLQERHKRIYSAMLKCGTPDQVSVAQAMDSLGILQKGDCTYLRKLVAESITSLDYEHFARIVKEYARPATTKKWGVKIE